MPKKPKNTLPEATIEISSREARRFLLAHQFLLPPRKLRGKDEVMKLIQRFGCIQYDTINVVGRNADLILQARIANYRPEILEELLYKERKLWDGWDKVQSIYHANDWPYFERKRRVHGEYYRKRSPEVAEYAPKIIELIRENGPLASTDIDHNETLTWTWGTETRLPRAAMEQLYFSGELGVHQKVGTKRVFDLVERLLPEEVLAQPDPHPNDEDFQDWHVLRRIGGLGLASARAGEHWGGMLGMKSDARKQSIRRLADAGKVLAVKIDGQERQPFFMRTEDQETLKEAQEKRAPRARAAFIAPLDNLMWDRKSIKQVFGFDYVWEVYKPAKQRKYGYYVLPVLYRDRFIARLDARLDRKNEILAINNWWWEPGVEMNGAMEKALATCLKEFMAYLGTHRLKLSGAAKRKKHLGWARL